MRQRLRPAYSQAELEKLYSVTYNHEHWEDHKMRIALSQSLIRTAVPSRGSIADLSCGDGAIINAFSDSQRLLGDFVPNEHNNYTGPIETTIHEIPHVNLFILSETIEHLNDPDTILGEIRETADFLFLSTPDSEFHTGNWEHYWGWDAEEIQRMMNVAGWTATHQIKTWTPYSAFQLWIAN